MYAQSCRLVMNGLVYFCDSVCLIEIILWYYLQDVLLVLYLANLTRTQLSLAEKLNTAAQIV